MKSWRIVLPALLLLGASAAWAQKVDVDGNRNIDFSKFKTYVWIESKHPGKGLWNQRIVDGVDAKLAKAGLKKSTPARSLISKWSTTRESKSTR